MKEGWGIGRGGWVVAMMGVAFLITASLALGQQEQLGIVETSPGNITMDFKDADINNVLRILSYKSGVNIITGKEVQGLVTIRLTDVPWEKALDVILRTYGFAYEREGNIIRVTTIESLEKEELATEVFVMNYAKAKEVQQSISDILSERGKVRIDERTNVLIVSDIPTNLYKISQVVSRLDKRTPQVLIDAKIIETTLSDDEKLGIDWQIQVAARGSAIGHTFPFNRKDLTDQFPSKFIGQGQTSSESTTTTTATGATSTATTTDFPFAFGFPFVQPEAFTFGTLAFDQFAQILEILESRRDTKILSAPRITTLNNQTAKILVGEVLGIPKFERNENTGNIEITGYAEKDLGVKLSVTPHVNDEGYIVVDLKPEISSLLGFDELTPEVRAPRFATREAQTQVLVKDGDTIAIGGLVSENKVDTVRKVPLLGDIPGLGYLFKQKIKADSKTDLLFFVTVRVLDEKVSRAMGQTLPGRAEEGPIRVEVEVPSALESAISEAAPEEVVSEAEDAEARAQEGFLEEVRPLSESEPASETPAP